MKKTITILFLAFTAIMANASILTVSNSTLLPGSPGQYTTLQAAVTAAFAGDTILVHGSANNYTDATITKKVTILGPGYNPQKQNPLVANFGGSSITFANGSSNSVIAGLFNVVFACNATITVSNITIKRNYANGVFCISLNNFCNGVIIEQNILASGISLGNAINVQIRNNVISKNLIYNIIGVQSSSSSTNQIKNNLFLCSGDAFTAVSNADISNNIFYETNPIKTDNSNVTLSAYNNNLTYNCTNGTVPAGSNVGSGNIINQDPIFLNAPDCGASSLTTILSYNWRLHVTSSAKNAGTDGTDIGPTGGVSPIYIYTTGPLAGEPAIPQVYFENIPISSVPVGGSFNVNVKARKKN